MAPLQAASPLHCLQDWEESLPNLLCSLTSCSHHIAPIHPLPGLFHTRILSVPFLTYFSHFIFYIVYILYMLYFIPFLSVVPCFCFWRHAAQLFLNCPSGINKSILIWSHPLACLCWICVSVAAYLWVHSFWIFSPSSLTSSFYRSLI